MRSKWKIEDLGEYISQQSIRNRGLENIEVYSVTNSEGFKKSTDYFSKEVFSKDLSNYKLVKRHQFAYNPSRINVGSIACLSDRDAALVSPLYVIFEVDKENLYPDYLLRYLKSYHGIVQIKNNTQGSVRDSLKYEGLRKIKVPLPPLEDQIRIATVLTGTETLITKRRESINAFDELLKSLFLEMFGDIRARKSIHPWGKLRPYLNAQSGKSSKGVLSAKKTAIPIYGGNGVNGWATKPLFLESVVIAGRVGQQCGVIHVSKGPCWVTDNAIVLRIKDKTKLNSIYLAYALTHSPILEKVRQLDLPFINQSMLLDILVPIPEIKSQIKFASIVEKVEEIKSKSTKSLTELENLYASICQSAFNGELNLTKIPIDIEINTESADIKMETQFPEMEITKRFSEKEFIKIVKKKLGKSFNFSELLNDVKENFEEPPSYEQLKDIVFSLLEGEKPLLSQFFDYDKDKKEIVLKVNI